MCIRDRFYSVLARNGYFPLEELKTFRQINSRLQGHPTTHEGLPGVRIASGSLGQGLSVGLGAAMAKKMNDDPSLVYTLHGDGELQEGQIWEAAIAGPGKKVDNLIACLLYTSDAADERSSGDLGGRRITKKKTRTEHARDENHITQT